MQSTGKSGARAAKVEATLGLVATLFVVVASTACDGGRNDNTDPPTPSSPVLGTSIAGTVAGGAAIADAPVAVSNAAGTAVCQEAQILTTSAGSYTCTLKAGESAPFFVVATDPIGTRAPFVSVVTTTPSSGATALANATPLTTAILAQLGGGDALNVVNARTVDTGALQQTTNNVVTQLVNVLNAVGVTGSFSPFSTEIVAATPGTGGNAADRLLDLVKVVTDPATGRLALATVESPTPIELSTASTIGLSLSAPAAGALALSEVTRVVAAAANACFALPVAQRVLAKDAHGVIRVTPALTISYDEVNELVRRIEAAFHYVVHARKEPHECCGKCDH